MAPSCCIIPITSEAYQTSANLSPLILKIPIPSILTLFPVGGIPIKGPLLVPVKAPGPLPDLGHEVFRGNAFGLQGPESFNDDGQ